MSTKLFRFGFATIIGRPNVGKSSLVNTITGLKTSITSRRPQTTRNRVIGSLTRSDFQLLLIDTPGIHDSPKLLNTRINRTAYKSLKTSDIVVMLIDARGWKKDDERIWKVIKDTTQTVIMVINKLDLLSNPVKVLPLIDQCSKLTGISEIIPISVKSGHNLESLVEIIRNSLPTQPAEALINIDALNDPKQSVAELIREQVFRLAGAEIPYRSAVIVEQERFDYGKPEYHAAIWVETPGQKAIVIGKDGERLKRISMRARNEIEMIFGNEIVLIVRVVVRKNWSSNPKDLSKLGYGD